MSSLVEKRVILSLDICIGSMGRFRILISYNLYCCGREGNDPHLHVHTLGALHSCCCCCCILPDMYKILAVLSVDYLGVRDLVGHVKSTTLSHWLDFYHFDGLCVSLVFWNWNLNDTIAVLESQ